LCGFDLLDGKFVQLEDADAAVVEEILNLPR